MRKIKPLVTWYGGKAKMAKIIAARLPPHRIYVEPYGGAGGVMMYKPTSKVEVYNDLHQGIVTLFRVVRDPAKCQKLVELLKLTPYARDEWKFCNFGWENEPDEIEKARKVYVALAQNFVGQTKNGAWSFGGPKHDGNVANSFYNSLENIPLVMKRLRNVLIENKPALELIEQWDSPEALFYFDPPYLPETRNRKNNEYKHEMSQEDHITLLNRCVNLKAGAIISSYPSTIYDEILGAAGWRCERFKSIATSSLQSSRNGLKGKPSNHAERTECIWINPQAQARTLWDLDLAI